MATESTQASGTRIRRIDGWRIKLPLNTIYASSMYFMSEAFRTVIRIETESGQVGLGETLGSPDVYALVRRLAQSSLGDCVHNRLPARRAFAKNIFSNRHGRNGYCALAGVELARWDGAARILEQPLCELLGGTHREHIEVVAPLPAGAFDTPATSAEFRQHFDNIANIDRLVQYAKHQHDRFGFKSFKYKSTALSPHWDVEIMTALRDALGEEAKLRFDPNAGYEAAQAINVCARLESLNLEWYEDPTDGIEGLATLRSRMRRPVATNMCVIHHDQILPAVARGAIDVLLADIYMWGGIENYVDMLSVANACGVEVAVHSLFESGIGTATNLHLAAAFPAIKRANDSGAHMLARDIVAGDPLAIDNGCMTLPKGGGLGVSLDLDALDALSVEQFEERL